MTSKTPNGTIKHQESTKPESRRAAKIGFFFFSSNMLVQNCTNHIQWFHTKQQPFYIEQCTTLPHNLKMSQVHLQPLTQVPCIRLRHHFQILYACTKTVMWQHIYELEQPLLNAVRTVWPLFQEASGYWKRT